MPYGMNRTEFPVVDCLGSAMALIRIREASEERMMYRRIEFLVSLGMKRSNINL
jgi:hypothetical protein